MQQASLSPCLVCIRYAQVYRNKTMVSIANDSRSRRGAISVVKFLPAIPDSGKGRGDFQSTVAPVVPTTNSPLQVYLLKQALILLKSEFGRPLPAHKLLPKVDLKTKPTRKLTVEGDFLLESPVTAL